MTDLLDRLKVALADRYTIQRELGAGGMATVYLAQDLKNKRRVAIKVVRPELSAVLGPERFLREVEITAQMNHPHILPLLDSGEADGFLHYVMPYMEGESLRDRLKREKQLPVEDALQIAREVADALGYAHRHDVVHRDIKPENILLQAQHAVVADFGIARAVSVAGGERLTATGVAVGTAEYMSPEQASGRGEVDARSDLYALGCVAYEMLAGHPPFMGTTAQEVLARHSLDAVPSLDAARPGVPLAVARAINRALAKVPADRFATTAEFTRALTAADVSPAEAPRPTSGVRRVAAMITGLVVVGAGVVLAAWLLWGPSATTALNPLLVVVPPFENRTGDASLDELGDLIASRLADAIPGYDVVEAVPATTVRDLLQTDLKGSSRLVEDLARRAGAPNAVVGEYRRLGDSVEVRAALVAAGSGTVLAPIDPVAGRAGSAGLLEALELRVMEALYFYFEWSGDDPRAYSRPSSLEAFREWTRGVEYHHRAEWTASIPYLQRVAALDPAWGYPLVFLAIAHEVAGQTAKADSVYGLLEQRRNTLGPGEVAWLDWHLAIRSGDRALEFRIVHRMFDRAPRMFAYMLAEAALSINRPAEAIEAARLRDTTSRWQREFPYWWSVPAAALHVLGRHEEELGVALDRRRRDPAAQNALDLELQARAAMGQTDTVARLLDQATAKAAGWGSGASLAYLEYLAHGHDDAARALLPRAVGRYEIYATQPGATRNDSVAYATALFWARDWQRCRDWWHRLAVNAPYPFLPERFLTYCAAGSGQRDEALRASDAWAADPSKDCPGCVSYYRAIVAAVLRDETRAVELLRQAFAEGYNYGVEIHRVWSALGLRDNPALQELLRAKG